MNPFWGPFGDPFGGLFGVIFGSFFRPRFGSVSGPILETLFLSFWPHFEVIFCLIFPTRFQRASWHVSDILFRPFEDQVEHKKQGKTLRGDVISSCRLFCPRFLSQAVPQTFWVSKWRPNGTQKRAQNRPQRIPKKKAKKRPQRRQFLGPNRRPKRCPKRRQKKGRKRAPKIENPEVPLRNARSLYI